MSIKDSKERTAQIYQRKAKSYDLSGIASLETKRRQANKELRLKSGDLIVDIGCGTGLNFSPLHKAVGSHGKIIGVDFSGAMLERARQKIVENQYENVELVQGDAASFDFPNETNGIISTLALTFIPEAADVIHNGAAALATGARWVVMDMAWPSGMPLWLRHLIPGLSAYGITRQEIEQRPWEKVWAAMKEILVDPQRRFFWTGFFYIASGQKP
ncbi:MAG: class I SAM-dependent methyltransferase [Anaerolineales bacterium]